MANVKPRPYQANPNRPCVVPGCAEPRRAYPSGRVVTRCRTHEIERVRSINLRPVLDDVTGETVSINALRQRRARREAQDGGA